MYLPLILYLKWHRVILCIQCIYVLICISRIFSKYCTTVFAYVWKLIKTLVFLALSLSTILCLVVFSLHTPLHPIHFYGYSLHILDMLIPFRTLYAVLCMHGNCISIINHFRIFCLIFLYCAF